jgi:hypothetical protein
MTAKPTGRESVGGCQGDRFYVQQPLLVVSGLARYTLLTYMSTQLQQQISTLIARKKLFCLESEMLGDETARTLFLTEEVRSAVYRPFPNNKGVLHAEFRQHLDAFLEGGCVSIGDDPKTKAAHALMARVAPVEDEFFDFRVTAPHPQIRAFGGFAARDTFVLVTWNYRAEIAEKFNEEVLRCKHEWQSLFGNITPFKGKSLNDYLTNFDPV